VVNTQAPAVRFPTHVWSRRYLSTRTVRNKGSRSERVYRKVKDSERASSTSRISKRWNLRWKRSAEGAEMMYKETRLAYGESGSTQPTLITPCAESSKQLKKSETELVEEKKDNSAENRNFKFWWKMGRNCSRLEAQQEQDSNSGRCWQLQSTTKSSQVRGGGWSRRWGSIFDSCAFCRQLHLSSQYYRHPVRRASVRLFRDKEWGRPYPSAAERVQSLVGGGIHQPRAIVQCISHQSTVTCCF